MHKNKLLLVQKGMKIISHKGYHATSIRDIIIAAGIPKGSFYYYFESKEMFCLEIINQLTENIDHSIEQVLKKTGDSGIKKIMDFFDTIFSFETRQGILLLKLVTELSERNDFLSEALQFLINSIVHEVSVVLESEISVNQPDEKAKYLFYSRLGVLSAQMSGNFDLTESFKIYSDEIV